VSASTCRLHARRPPSGPVPTVETDPDVVGAYLEDASGRPPGTAAGVLRPEGPESVARWVAATAGTGVRVLPQAARSSLTGGAVPEGEVVLSVERLDGVGAVVAEGGRGRVRVGAGVRLRDLQADLAAQGWYFPPVPTYQEAMVGGVVSTNAGGAATFKYGTTRAWVRGVIVVLADGRMLALERGQAVVARGGTLVIERDGDSAWNVQAPDWTLPSVPKISAGYHASDPFDAVDLFVGAEGTLGIVVEADLDVVPAPAAVLTAVAFVSDERAAVRLAADARSRAERIRGGRGGDGPDVRAIELVDGRGLDLLRAHGDLARVRVEVPHGAGAALLLEVELPEACSTEVALEELEAWAGPADGARGPLSRSLRALFDVLADHDALDSLQVAFPDDLARRDALVGFREAVPTRVNEILAERRRADPGVRKVGGDLIVPFDRVETLLDVYREEFERRGLEYAVWGHLSDGNLHPNALARTSAEVRSGEQALLRFADEAVAMGGSPLSEHGVGRSGLKQEMLRRFLGDAAVGRMRAIKRALDPGGRLAPGVLFPAR